MNFDLSEEQHMLAEQARGLITERVSFDRLRDLIEQGAEWDEPLWRELGQMGYLGVTIAEEFGGMGMTALDLGVVQQEFGRGNVAIPYFSSIVLAAEALQQAGSVSQKSKWLPRLGSGEIVACFAYAEGPGALLGQKCSLTDGRVTGVKTPVADAGVADIAIVQVGDQLAIVELQQDGVTREKLNSFDQLRPHYRLSFDGAAAEVLPASSHDMIIALLDKAAVQTSFEATGAAEACLMMARDYALERQMFGRPLASFQAIKHKLADLAVSVELARSSAYFAAWAADEAAEQLPAAAAAAKLTSAKAFEASARENLQVHGGIGYTFEANCHFFYRRERTLAVSIGTREYWAGRLLDNRHQDTAA